MSDSGYLFDFKVLARCEYGVNGYKGVVDCGEPATHRVWWGDGTPMNVCQEHFSKIEEAEIKGKS